MLSWVLRKPNHPGRGPRHHNTGLPGTLGPKSGHTQHQDGSVTRMTPGPRWESQAALHEDKCQPRVHGGGGGGRLCPVLPQAPIFKMRTLNSQKEVAYSKSQTQAGPGSRPDSPRSRRTPPPRPVSPVPRAFPSLGSATRPELRVAHVDSGFNTCRWCGHRRVRTDVPTRTAVCACACVPLVTSSLRPPQRGAHPAR